MMDSIIVIMTLIVYKFLLLGVGWWASKRVPDESDFFWQAAAMAAGSAHGQRG